MGDGWQVCSSHGDRYPDYGDCPSCIDEREADEARQRQRRREDEEGVCEACGQRFIERTRVQKPAGKQWVGALARYAAVGVCPACANKYGAF